MMDAIGMAKPSPEAKGRWLAKSIYALEEQNVKLAEVGSRSGKGRKGLARENVAKVTGGGHLE
ncbi:hypothetical protein IBT47_06495 [Erwinia sp. S43]|uniref:hypothetical protein n=1 Tax=Erwinia sp. S43 TaxID=2769339 RepID=UPI001909A03E|nr:hypothetical protein [Erwinia sp. S43]MBK0031923.1 hypothetical protein [Erwinia sp. S43]